MNKGVIMKKTVSYLMQRIALIFMILSLLVIWGAYSVYQMKKEYMPDINNPILMVTLPTGTTSISSSEASRLNDKLTTSLKNVDHLQSIESTIYSNGLFFKLTFPQNGDGKTEEADVKRTLEGLSLPPTIGSPITQQIRSDAFPVMKISLSSKKISEHVLRTSKSKQIINQLNNIPGVKEIQTTGDGDQGFSISLDNEKLKKMGVHYNQVVSALKKQHVTLSNGIIQLNNVHLPLHITESSMTKKTLGSLVVGTSNHKSVLLKDVADIESSLVHVHTTARTNGHASVVLSVIKTPSADVTKVSEAVSKKLSGLSDIKNGTVNENVLINRGSSVSKAIDGLWKEGLLGCVFSILCVFVFFRQWRSSLAVILSLPICFFGALGILTAMGQTLNLLTMSGLIVSMGRVVDDSIVILDNMYRKLEKQRTFSIAGLAGGVKEMIPAVISSTLTTIAVYLPLALTGTMVGHAFSGFAWAVTFSLLFSLIVSLVILPPLAALSWRRQLDFNAPNTEKRARPVISLLLKKRHVLFAGMTAALIITTWAAFYLPLSVLPRSHASDLNIQIETPEGSTLKQVNEEVMSFESLLNKHSDIKSYASSTGATFSPVFDDVFDQGGGWIQQGNIANIFVTPKNRENADQLRKELKQDIQNISTNAVYTVSNQKISGDDSRVSITLTGKSHKELSKMASLLRNKLQMIKGLQMSGEANGSDQLMFNIVLSRDKIQEEGLDNQAIVNKLENFMAFHESVNLSLDGKAIPVDINKSSDVAIDFQQGADPAKKVLLMLGNLSFKGKNGKQVRLSQFSKLNVNPALAKSFKDGNPAAIVTGNIVDPDISNVTKQVKNTINELNIPKGIKVEYGGISQQMKQMVVSISIAAIISLVLVLCIVSAVFKGIRGPLAVLASLPFSFIGSFLFLWAFGKSWNLGALVGLIMLIGIVATNGIVLVDRMERLRQKNLPMGEVLLDGTASRVRPVLMTAATTVLTLLPLSFSHRSDTLISQSLGLVVTGGMITGTLTSFIIIPTIYAWLNKRKNHLVNDK